MDAGSPGYWYGNWMSVPIPIEQPRSPAFTVVIFYIPGSSAAIIPGCVAHFGFSITMGREPWNAVTGFPFYAASSKEGAVLFFYNRGQRFHIFLFAENYNTKVAI